jgi:hypothetical protein
VITFLPAWTDLVYINTTTICLPRPPCHMVVQGPHAQSGHACEGKKVYHVLIHLLYIILIIISTFSEIVFISESVRSLYHIRSITREDRVDNFSLKILVSSAYVLSSPSTLLREASIAKLCRRPLSNGSAAAVANSLAGIFRSNKSSSSAYVRSLGSGNR